MYKTIFNKRNSILFKRFSNKGYSLFSVLRKEVLIGTLSVATLTNAKAQSISVNEAKTDSTVLGKEKEVDLSEVLITASRAPLTVAQQSRMVKVLGSEEIRAIAAQSVNDLLKHVIAIDVRQRGAIGAQTDISLRGGTFEQVAILVNGINIGDPQTGHNAFDIPVDMSEIERIEVLEGPAGRVYGTSSLLGAINIITKLTKDNNVRAFAKAGSYGFFSGGAALNLSQSRFTNALSASYTRSDGYSVSSKGHHNMDFEGGKAFYQGRYNTNLLQLNWHAGLSSKGWGSNLFYGASDDQYEHTFKTFTALQADTKKGFMKLHGAIYWNRNEDRYEWHRGNENPVPFNYARSNVYGTNINTYFDWTAGKTAIGLDLRQEDLVSTTLGELMAKAKHISGTNRDYTKEFNRTNVSIFFEHNLILDKFSASLGIISSYNSWIKGGMRVYPGIDIAYQLLPTLKVYASYNSSLRLPTATELFYKYKGFEPNKYLKPEELSAFELGVKHQTPVLTASAKVYFNHLRNQIDWIGSTDATGNFVWKSVNFGKINSVGTELALDLSLQQLWPTQKIMKNFSLAYAHIHQNSHKDAGLQSRYVLEYLRNKLSASLALSPLKDLNTTIMYRYLDRTGSVVISPTQTEKYRPYGVVDCRVSLDKPRYSCFVEANNLFNKKYYDYGRIPQPGFWIMAGASFNINL